MIKNVVYFICVSLCFFNILHSCFRPLFFLLFLNQINHWIIFHHHSVAVLEPNLRRGQLSWPLQNKVQNGVFWWESCLYRAHTSPGCRTLANFLQQPITIQHSLSMIDFSARGWSKGCRTKKNHLQAPLLLVPCTCSCWWKPSRTF